MKKKLLCLALALMMALPLLAACGAPANTPAPAAEPTPAPATPAPAGTAEPAPAEPAPAESGAIKTIKEGKLILGTSPDYPPYEFPMVGQGGSMEIVGFDVEIAKIIAQDLGLELEIQAMDFDGLLAALQAGAIDMVLAGMNPDEERKKAVDFSMIYYYADHAMIVRADEKDALAGAEAFAGKIVGAQTGTTQEEIANGMKEELSDLDVVSLKQVPTLVMELKTKKVDGVIMEKPVADSYVKQNPDLVVAYTIPNPETDEGVAVAVKKDSPDFVAAINKTLERIMNDGTIERLFSEAFELQEQAAE